jgi:hypothetical protein
MSGQQVDVVRTPAQHRTVGSPGTIAVSRVWAMGRRCTVAALQPPLSTRLAGAWCMLVVRRLRRCAHSPKGDHDGHARGISDYFNSTQTVGPSRHTWQPRAWQRELEPQDTWWPRSCPGLDSGSWSRKARGGHGAAPGWAAGAGAAGHVAAPKPTSVGRQDPELQLVWQRVNTCPAPCLDLELVCGGTRSSGYRQWPPGPPRERLRTRRWGQFFGAPLGYLDLFTRQSTTGL